MLVRKKIGSQLVGIDLPGFVKQVDDILAELRPEPSRVVRTTTVQGMMPIKAPAGPRVPHALRARLGPIAVDAFLEYALARGARRNRLRPSWHSLRDMISVQRAVLGPGQLSKHKAGGQQLAKELGKHVDIQFELETVEATGEILAAVDTAMLHLVRNAVDHGIEAPAERTAAGKPQAGSIRARVQQEGELLLLTVEDDGGGVALDEVRRRALDRGLIAPEETDIDQRWLDLICQPGFTTRAVASDVSGRGVGLDAVRVGIHELGGTLTAQTFAGRGTSWRIKVPLPRVTVGAWQFRVPGVPFPVAIASSWSPVEHAPGAPVYDLAHVLGFSEEPATSTVCYFCEGDVAVGLAIDRAPQPAEVRRLIDAAESALGEVMMAEAAEGLLVNPRRLLSR
jgi:hypothetical protein